MKVFYQDVKVEVFLNEQGVVKVQTNVQSNIRITQVKHFVLINTKEIKLWFKMRLVHIWDINLCDINFEVDLINKEVKDIQNEDFKVIYLYVIKVKVYSNVIILEIQEVTFLIVLKEENYLYDVIKVFDDRNIFCVIKLVTYVNDNIKGINVKVMRFKVYNFQDEKVYLIGNGNYENVNFLILQDNMENNLKVLVDLEDDEEMVIDRFIEQKVIKEEVMNFMVVLQEIVYINLMN